MHRYIALGSIGIATLVACGGSQDEGANGTLSTGADSGGVGVGGADGTASFGAGAQGPGTTGAGGGPADGCRRVDLVISVDNSGSMSEEKASIANDVFPKFATALQQIGGGLDDYRIGVLDACPTPANYHTRGMAAECNFSSGKVWMESSSPNIVDEFQCVGDIYSGDSTCSGNDDDEQPASAAAASLEAPASTGPNAGFLRKDALLVVIGITDEDEQPTPKMGAQEIYDRLVAIKGDVKQMVFLGIGGATACDGIYGSAKKAERLKDTTDLFVAQGRGVFWDLCMGKLEDGLQQAMTVIDQACNEFPSAPK